MEKNCGMVVMVMIVYSGGECNDSAESIVMPGKISIISWFSSANI